MAFATPRHADDALASLMKARHLIASAEHHRCSVTHDDMGLLDIVALPANVERIRILAMGLHGIVVPQATSPLTH